MMKNFKQHLLAIFLFVTSTILAQNGTSVFNESEVHEINVTVPYEGLIDTLYTHYFDKTYTLCDIVFDETIVDSVGIRFKGNYSFLFANTSDKKPIKFDFSEFVPSKKYDGLTKLNLVNGYGDPSFFRDAVSYKILRESGVPAPRSSYAKLYINNNYFGLYLLVEEQDKKFLEQNNFPDKNGNMYKANISGLEWESNLKKDYVDNFEQQLKHSGDTSWTDLINFHQITSDSSPQFYDNLVENFQTNYFLKSIATDFVVANFDNIIGHQKNFSLYHSTSDNKFYWLPWDYSFAFQYELPFNNLLWDEFAENVFWQQCMTIPGLQNQYLQNVCEINDIVTNTYLNPYINAMRDLILPALTDDPNKFYPVNKFNAAIDSITVSVVASFIPGTSEPVYASYPGLKYMVTDRHNAVASLLENFGVNCTIGIDRPELTDVKVYPNPASDFLNIEIADKMEYTIKIFRIDGKLVSNFNSVSESVIHLNIKDLANGMYFIILKNEKSIIERKFIKN